MEEFDIEAAYGINDPFIVMPPPPKPKRVPKPKRIPSPEEIAARRRESIAARARECILRARANRYADALRAVLHVPELIELRLAAGLSYVGPDDVARWEAERLARLKHDADMAIICKALQAQPEREARLRTMHIDRAGATAPHVASTPEKPQITIHTASPVITRDSSAATDRLRAQAASMSRSREVHKPPDAPGSSEQAGSTYTPRNRENGSLMSATGAGTKD